jgi:hypothetical protein
MVPNQDARDVILEELTSPRDEYEVALVASTDFSLEPCAAYRFVKLCL